MNCTLCQCQECTQIENTVNKNEVFECKNCGKYSLTAPAKPAIGENGWMLAAYVFAQNRLGINPIFYSSQKSLTVPRPEVGRSLKDEDPEGSVGIDAAIETFPKTLPERLDRALLNLAEVSKFLGQAIRIANHTVHPMLLAQNKAEASFIIDQFASEGFITVSNNGLPTDVVITARGLNRVADLQRGLFGPLNKQVFVAMSFHSSLDGAWLEGLKPGIEDKDCGYKAFRVDIKEHNDKICDVIIAEIRKSKFLVADFTLHRGGVYFEAGLMMGLGRPVIFTCREDQLEGAHFDTRQYSHIVWKTPEELREKLKRRIQATIAP
jgi:hypothetical protein